MRVTFLFWNLKKNLLHENVIRVVVNFAVDVVILAEYALDTALLISELSSRTGKQFCKPPSASEKIHIFTSFKPSQLTDRFTNNPGGLTIRHMKVPDLQGILLAVVHFPSKVSWDNADQSQEATVWAADIKRTEEESGNVRTVLVGDLNMNPFEAGVVGARSLHAVMTRAIADKRYRDVSGTASNGFFYNPMWGLFGDRTNGPAGTYFLSSSKPVNHFWNIYDQVLLRPDLMHKLTDLCILDTDGVTSLVSGSSAPHVSDHLPLLFQLDL